MAVDIPWKVLSEVYGFVGNSLLKPMTMTATVGLDPAFWAEFPAFDDENVAAAVAVCAHYAEGAQRTSATGENPVERCAVEYTRLFVGPPSPASPPWETMHRTQGATVGFGQATFEMRELLRSAELELRNENNQYEDHLGIELLYLSELCRRRAAEKAEIAGNVSAAKVEGAAKSEPASKDAVTKGEPDSVAAANSPVASVDAVAAFIDEHPLAWIDKLQVSVAESFPDGYFVNLLVLVHAVLVWHRAQLGD